MPQLLASLDRGWARWQHPAGTGCSTRHAVRRPRDAVDFPDLSAERDNVRRVPNELERRWLVQTLRDNGEGAVLVDLHQGAGVRQRRSTRLVADLKVTLRQGIESATATKFHVDDEASAGGHLRGNERLRPERHNLAVLRQVGDRAGLGHVHRVAHHGKSGRDDVVERNQLGDLAVECDRQHAVVVPIGDQEPVTEDFHRILDASRDEERCVRGILQSEGADVRDDGETVRPVHSVDADNVAAAHVRGDKGNQRVRSLTDERDVHRPADADDTGRQTAGKRRDLPGYWIDAQDPASRGFGDVQRTTRADGAARATRKARDQQHGSGPPDLCRGPRRGRRVHRDQERGQQQKLSFATHRNLPQRAAAALAAPIPRQATRAPCATRHPVRIGAFTCTRGNGPQTGSLRKAPGVDLASAS